MSSNFTSEYFINALKTGNRLAQVQLYEQYAKAMYNICMRLLPDEDQAKDVLQESFISVFSKFSSYNKESTIGAWIKKIVINKCIDSLKQNKKSPLVYKEEIEDEWIEDEDKDVIQWQDYNINIIKKAIKELPEGYRTVFHLFVLEDYSHKEIGEFLNISESTSKSQYFKAKKRIQSYVNNNTNG